MLADRERYSFLVQAPSVAAVVGPSLVVMELRWAEQVLPYLWESG